MSDGTPANDTPIEFVRPSAELSLQENVSRLKLFKILKQAWKHLSLELCPYQPKSIRCKATDLYRNVPRWQHYIGELRMSPVGAVDLKREFKVCDEIMKTVIFVIAELSNAIDEDLQNPLVHAAWQKLTSTVRSALEEIGGMFSVTTIDWGSENSVEKQTNNV